eukprot:gene2037-3957_t
MNTVQKSLANMFLDIKDQNVDLSLIDMGPTDSLDEFNENEENKAKETVEYVSPVVLEPYSQPIFIIRHRACEMAHMSLEEAYHIDGDVKLTTRIPEDGFVNLAGRFYKNLFENGPEELKCLFNESKRNDQVKHLSEYLIQRCGGHAAYSDHRGTPTLITRHAKIPITKELAEKWLEIMEETFDELSDIFDDSSRYKLMSFLTFTAFSMVASQEAMMRAERAQGEYSYLNE